MHNIIDCTQDRIIRYIEHLKKNYGWSLSVHLSAKYSFSDETIARLSDYNFHTNPYCFFVKNIRAQHQKCIECQANILKRCGEAASFIDYCHAAVGQYIHRITANNAVVGFLCVSGYQHPHAASPDDGWYDTYLSPAKIPVEELDILIPPLALMLSGLFSQCLQPPAEDVYAQILNYLDNNHNTSLEQLSKDLGYSKSHISHLFRSRSGYTLKAYCNQLKIKEAETLLRTTNLSITDIALASGFNNISYFISTFREITGQSPAAWRKGWK